MGAGEYPGGHPSARDNNRPTNFGGTGMEMRHLTDPRKIGIPGDTGMSARENRRRQPAADQDAAVEEARRVRRADNRDAAVAAILACPVSRWRRCGRGN